MPPQQQNPYAQQPQQNAQGQYDVLPPLPGGPNTGHSGHNPYEFIVNPNTPKHSPAKFGKQLLLLAGGAVILLIVIGTVISALAPKGVTPELTAIAQRQQEIIRVAAAGSNQTTSQDAKNFVLTTQLSVSTDQASTISYLASHGTKLKPKVLALDQNAQTDSLLASAANAGTYDSAIVGNLQDQLKTYENLLAKAYKDTGSKTAKQLLQTSYTNAAKLVTQAQNVAPASN